VAAGNTVIYPDKIKDNKEAKFDVMAVEFCNVILPLIRK